MTGLSIPVLLCLNLAFCLDASEIVIGSTLPTSCAEGSIFFRNPAFFTCTGAGVWQPVDPLAKGIYNVALFGATGDAHTDDGRALQQASDAALRNHGGVVFLPPGQYLHTGIIDLPANSTLEGSGEDSVLIA